MYIKCESRSAPRPVSVIRKVSRGRTSSNAARTRARRWVPSICAPEPTKKLQCGWANYSNDVHCVWGVGPRAQCAEMCAPCCCERLATENLSPGRKLCVALAELLCRRPERKLVSPACCAGKEMGWTNARGGSSCVCVCAFFFQTNDETRA